MQRLQQIVSKIIMLAMLFTVITSSVSAGSLNSKAQPTRGDCQMTCCEMLASLYQEHVTMCSVDAMDEHNPSPSCCIDHDCHANNMQFAILSHLSQISVPSTGQVFTEPVGKRQFFYDVILRPPVLS